MAASGRQTPISATAGPRPIRAGDDRPEWDTGGHFRKLHPLLPEVAPSLGVDGDRSTEREHEQRAEEYQGREITVDDEVDQRPESDSAQEWVPANANHPPRDVGPVGELRFHANPRRTRRRNPIAHKEERYEHKHVRRQPKSK